MLSNELLKISRLKTENFTRNRVLSFVYLTTFIINFVKRSLQLELYNFTDWLNVLNVTKQAFSKARKKLSFTVFISLNEVLIKEFYSDNGSVKSFKGLRLLAVDGSILRLPSDINLYTHFGRDEINKSIPMAQSSILFDVLNHLALDAIIAPYKASERDLALEHVTKLISQNYEHQEFKDLLIFDRGYASRLLMFWINDHKNHFLMRVQRNFLSEVTDVINSNLHDAIIIIPAFSKNKDTNPNFKKHLPSLHKDAQLTVRVLVFDLNNGEKEVIVTSLINQSEFSYDDIFKLYTMRWNIEEGYKFYKSITEIENFSGKSVLAIQQDFHATVFACNAATLVMQEAQDELDETEILKNREQLQTIDSDAENTLNANVINSTKKYKYKINRNILVGIMKNEIIDILLRRKDLSEYCESLKNRIKKNLIPIRPNRIFPRIPKRRSGPTYKRRAL